MTDKDSDGAGKCTSGSNGGCHKWRRVYAEPCYSNDVDVKVRMRQYFLTSAKMTRDGIFSSETDKREHRIPWASDPTLCLKHKTSGNWKIFLGSCNDDSWWSSFELNPPVKENGHWVQTGPIRVQLGSASKYLAIHVTSNKISYINDPSTGGWHYNFERKRVDEGYVWNTVTNGHVIKRRIQGGTTAQNVPIIITDQCAVNVGEADGYGTQMTILNTRKDENGYFMKGMLNSEQNLITWDTYPVATYWKKIGDCPGTTGC